MAKQTETCAAENCENEFDKRTHNQIYCSTECCHVETNKKMKAAYHERVAIQRGKPRYCSQCEITKLSRYNTGKICGSCENANKQNNSDFLNRLVSITS